MKTEEKLKKLFTLLWKNVQNDPKLLLEVEQLLGETRPKSELTVHSVRPRNRRNPAPFDPFAAYQEGESALVDRLRELDIEMLKDIVAECGMDPAKLVLKWKSKDRIAEHIFNTVQSRFKKGDAFRS
jgi:hypothetical protein